jgi:uncharacterized membrane protein
MAQTHSTEPLVYRPMSLPPRRKVGLDAPLRWLREGRRYLDRARGVSLLYGGVFAVAGIIITLLGLNQPQFILTFWSGFLLVGPLLAIGLFRIAQLVDRGESLRLMTCVGLLRKNLGAVALFTLLLSLIMVAWIRFSTLAAALYVGNLAGANGFLGVLATPEGLGFLAVLFGVGAIFAVLLFALTAWSLPMVLDGRTDFGTAIVTSVRATFEQPLAMLAWGATVAVLTILGMLTFFTGFAVIFPLLGYASWAAYKDIFGRA